MIHALIVGLAAIAVDLILSRIIARWATRDGRWLDRVGSWPEACPPLAVGVGVLAIPEGLRMLGEMLPASTWRPSPAELLGSAADFFDVDRTSWAALIFAVALVRLPHLARSALARRRVISPVWIDAAVSLGASPREAHRVATGWSLGVPISSAVLAVALALTNVTPALLFTPTADVRTVGPAVLTVMDEPGGLPRAATLALAAVAVNLVALAFAARGERRAVAATAPRG